MTTNGVVVGQMGKTLLHDNGETHGLLVGPSRSGKGTSTIIPTLLTWRGSALILDPKDGENLDVTGPWRQHLGCVAAFTPCRTPQACLNILETVRLRTPHEFADAHLIAQSLTAPEKLARESATGIHFRELAAMLLTTAILHVLYTSRRRSLPGVWDFLTQQEQDLSATLTVMATTAPPPIWHQALRLYGIRNISGIGLSACGLRRSVRWCSTPIRWWRRTETSR
jgi:type IV secretion system protein VirD4